MRTTLDLNEKLLMKAMNIGHARTKTELIHASLEAFIQSKRVERLIARGGRTPLRLTLRHLQRMRRED